RKGLEDGAFGRRGVCWRCYKRSHAESRRHCRLFSRCDHSQTDRSEKPKGSLEGDRRLSLWRRCGDVRRLKTFSGGQRPDDQRSGAEEGFRGNKRERFKRGNEEANIRTSRAYGNQY